MRGSPAPVMRRYLLLSAGAHVALALSLLLGAVVLPSAMVAVPAEPATVEMILKAPGEGDAPRQAGAGKQAVRAAPPPTAPPPAPRVPPPPPEQAEALPLPPPTPPMPQEAKPPGPRIPEALPAPAAPPAEPAPAIRLGLGGIAGITNDISGDIPVSPDPSAPNLPPRYPREAVERGEQGAVILAVTITPEGRAGSVSIAATSGFPVLDRAAQLAVTRWRFKPEVDEAGTPVSSRLPIRINFVLN